MSLYLAMIPQRHSNDERETPMTSQTATAAFINALIVRFRAPVTTGALPQGLATKHPGSNATAFDPILIPAYRRRRLLRRPCTTFDARLGKECEN